MSDYPTEKDIEVLRRRRPSIESKFTLSRDWSWSSGAELTMTRAGVVVGGYYDSSVGLQSFLIPWEMFDRERAGVMGTGK